MHGAKAMTEHEDKSALVVILQSVPLEMMCIITTKDITQDMWNTMRMMCMGVERVWEAKT